MSTNFFGVTMTPQIDDTKQVNGPSPSKGAAAGGAPHKRTLYLALALVVVVALLVTGIWSRVRAGKKLSAETVQVADRKSVV